MCPVGCLFFLLLKGNLGGDLKILLLPEGAVLVIIVESTENCLGLIMPALRYNCPDSVLVMDYEFSAEKTYASAERRE